MDTFYIDGNFVKENVAWLSVKDIAVLRGFGVFDFLITYKKRPFHLEEHVVRLKNSAKEIGLSIQHTTSQICDIVNKTIQKNPGHKESNIRIIYTGGISPDGITPHGNGKLLVMVTQKTPLPQEWYTKGVAIGTVNMERCLPLSKSTNYLSAVYAQQQVRDAGAIEAVYIDRNNRALEGTTSNIFSIKNQVLITPNESILPGITRQVVLKLIQENQFKLELRHIDKDEFKDMDEVFITASNKEIVPVVKIDHTDVKNGKPGELTQVIMKLFKEYTIAYGNNLIAANKQSTGNKF